MFRDIKTKNHIHIDRQIVYHTPSTYYKHSIKRDLHSPLKEEERNTIKELSNRR